MKNLLQSLSFTCLLLVLTSAAAHCLAEEAEASIKIQLYPSAEPKPALKYKLLPSRADQIAGNAAVYYGKVKAEQTNFFSNRELRDNIERWQKTPLEELVVEEAHVPSGGSINFYLDRAAHCRYCDWQMPIGDVRFYTTLLPELQESREFCRILAACARIDIAHRRYEKALQKFQNNYALGRHVAESEFIVGGLVGVAICETVNAQITTFVQQPDTPNLYWALTALPSPLIHMRKAIELESHGLELSYPELGNYEGVGLRSFGSDEQTHPELWKIAPSRRTPEEWKKLYHAIVLDVLGLVANDDFNPQEVSEEQYEKNCQSMLPVVKKYLRDQGMTAKRVESMSVHQAALLYTLHSFHEQVDDMAKYYGLPYPQAIVGLDAVIKHYKEAMKNIPKEFNVGSHLVPAIKAAKQAEVRLDREIAVLRIFEALRIYGASHAGKLPESLSDILEVPVPMDPVTGKPFEYQLNNGVGTLKGPTLRSHILDYEITMQMP